MTLRILGDSIPGNCLKVKWTRDLPRIEYDREEIDILKGETRSAAFLATNPAGQVPVIRSDDGRSLARSNAILLYLAYPRDPDGDKLCALHRMPAA